MKHHARVHLVVLLFFLGGFVAPQTWSTANAQRKPEHHKFSVGKMDKTWRVYEDKNHGNHVIKASVGDTVTWTASGTNLVFQFPEKTLFGTDNATIQDGKSLTLVVQPSAKKGRHIYAVFCTKGGVYASGDSPPVIIIQ